jgi:hypothetical protein
VGGAAVAAGGTAVAVGSAAAAAAVTDGAVVVVACAVADGVVPRGVTGSGSLPLLAITSFACSDGGCMRRTAARASVLRARR